jgi:hypothetical protein
MRNRKFAFLAAVSLMLVLAAWAREDKLTNTGLAPAAEGKVITSTDRNGNTEVEVKVKHVATPQSLTPAHQSYLVWIQPRGGAPELLGALRVNENLEGSLKATTLHKTFDILITAEDSLKPEMPSSNTVLKGTIERK